MPFGPQIRDHGIEHRHLDVIALAGPLAGIQRRRHRLRGEDRGGLVADDRADHLWPVGHRMRLDVSKAGQSLDDRIIDPLLDVRSGVADAADRYIDQARMALAQLVSAEAEPLHGARPEILHQHVGLRDQPGQHLAAGVALDVDRQRALATIRRDEQRGELAALVDAGAAAPGDIAADRFDLEHVRALVGEEHRRERSGNHAGQIQYTDAIEWP